MEQRSPQSDFEADIVSLFKKRPSVCLAYEGRRGTGKTDGALLTADVLHSCGIIKNIATNINTWDAPFHIEKITNLDDLESWASQTRGRNLFIGDEWGKAFRKRTPMGRFNVDFMDDLQTLRKFGPLSLILCFPAETYVDNSIFGFDVLDGILMKPQFNNPKIAYYHDALENYTLKYEDLPRTRIRFDTFDKAQFTRHGDKKKRVFKDDDKQFLYDISQKNQDAMTGQERKRKKRLFDKILADFLAD